MNNEQVQKAYGVGQTWRCLTIRKVVLVTGAGAGIGRACALAFGKRGAKVCVDSVDESGSGGGNPLPGAERACLCRQTSKTAAGGADGSLRLPMESWTYRWCAGIVIGSSVVETDLETWNP